MTAPSRVRAASRASRASDDDPGDRRPLVGGVVRGGPLLLDHAGQGQQGAPGRAAPPPASSPELIAVAGQGDRVEPVVLGPSRPFDPEAELHGPPADPLADEPLQLGLKRAVGVADPGRELQVAVVDRADLDRDGPVRSWWRASPKPVMLSSKGDLESEERSGKTAEPTVDRGSRLRRRDQQAAVGGRTWATGRSGRSAGSSAVEVWPSSGGGRVDLGPSAGAGDEAGRRVRRPVPLASPSPALVLRTMPRSVVDSEVGGVGVEGRDDGLLARSG